MNIIPIGSSGADVNSGHQPEQAGRGGGEGGDESNSREELSPPIAAGVSEGAAEVGGSAVTVVAEQCREGTEAAASVEREETEGPLRWWLEIVGAGEVSPISMTPARRF